MLNQVDLSTASTEDADRFGLPVEKLVSQVTGLLARPAVGGGYEFQRSL
ncbi:hypothetical protein [Leptolyngbya sp. FACHB-1624]